MRAREDREVMYHLMRIKPDDELHLRVYLPRRVLHYAWTKIAGKYPLVIKGELDGKERLMNLAAREEGPMRLPVLTKDQIIERAAATAKQTLAQGRSLADDLRHQRLVAQLARAAVHEGMMIADAEAETGYQSPQ